MIDNLKKELTSFLESIKSIQNESQIRNAIIIISIEQWLLRDQIIHIDTLHRFNVNICFLLTFLDSRIQSTYSFLQKKTKNKKQ